MTNVTIRVIDCHVVYLKNNHPKFLMLKRSLDKIYGGTWQCVTGKIKPHEKPIESAIRELNEETGLNPLNKWSIDCVNQFYEAEFDRMNIIPVFGVEVDSMIVKLSNEHSDYCWCNIDEAIELFTWDQQKNGLIQFHDMLIQKTEKLTFLKIK